MVTTGACCDLQPAPKAQHQPRQQGSDNKGVDRIEPYKPQHICKSEQAAEELPGDVREAARPRVLHEGGEVIHINVAGERMHSHRNPHPYE